jgi:DNA-directed RNA polymerase specialized sigma24 family protein
MSFEKETPGLLKATDQQMVKQLYDAYAKKLLGYTLKNYTIDKDSALAVVYKTIYKVADVIGNYSFENEQKKSAFIFKTHINFLRNFFRDNKTFEHRNLSVELDENLAGADTEAGGPPNQQLQILRQELDKLEDWQRILLLMRGQDMPYGKIAEFVNKPERQLKVYYARLKKQLAENISAALQQLKKN